MTMPLTRETLAELRRLKKVRDELADCRTPGESALQFHMRRKAYDAAGTDIWRLVFNNLSALLDAAERGLDVGDGR